MVRLSLSLLGAFNAILDGSPISGFKTDKVRALLATWRWGGTGCSVLPPSADRQWFVSMISRSVLSLSCLSSSTALMSK
jgi:hypothetical protein